MKRKSVILFLAVAALGLFLAACGDDKIVREEVHLLYNDIYGVVEYEADGEYPPPASDDNLPDDYIMVLLYFGENIGIYKVNDVYGYSVTTDYNDENFYFPFVPDGNYWLRAEFTNLDSCFMEESDTFFHSDTADTFVELRPTFYGLNKGCFFVTLSGVSEGEMVQVGKRTWVTRQVYEDFYKGKEGSAEITR